MGTKRRKFYIFIPGNSQAKPKNVPNRREIQFLPPSELGYDDDKKSDVSIVLRSNVSSPMNRSTRRICLHVQPQMTAHTSRMGPRSVTYYPSLPFLAVGHIASFTARIPVNWANIKRSSCKVNGESSHSSPFHPSSILFRSFFGCH